MKFKVQKIALEKAMMQLDAIVPGRDTQTLLSNVLVSTRDDVVQITASDMESTVRITLNATDIESGELILKAKKLSEIARQLNTKEVIFSASIEDDSDSKEGTQYTIRLEGDASKAAKFRMSGSDRSHFPEMNEISKQKLSSIPSAILSEMISKTFFSISQEDNRYIYNGIYFIANGKKLTLVGTDGRRLAAISRELPEPIQLGSPETGDVVVHAKAIRELQKIIDSDNDVFFGVEQRDIFFKVGNAELSSRLLEGKFPDYKKVIPEMSAFGFDISRAELMDAIRQVMVMTEQPSFQVRMVINSSGVKMMANTPDVGEAEIDLPVEGLDADMEIGFNANYFMDILKSLSTDKVKVKFNDPARPILFEEVQDPEFTALVMPMKI